MWIFDLFKRRKRLDIRAPRVRVTILCGPSFYQPTRLLPPARLIRTAMFC